MDSGESSLFNTQLILMGYYRTLRPTYNWKVDFRDILFIDMYTSFLKFELQTLSDEFTVETKSFKCWLKISPKCYVKNISGPLPHRK